MVLGKTVAGLVRKPTRRRIEESNRPVVEERPGCAFGLVTRKGLEDLSKDFERLESKINGLIFGVIITVLLETWKAMG